jgi:Heterokaryon incompatibility protein (HET)
MSRKPNYRHTPLTGDSIRLLRIRRVEPEVECTLHHFPRRTCPYYEAISYSWGIQPLSESITLDDFRYDVTPHLYDGLRRIFASLKSKWLWVDAISISQTDVVEKASQVALMHATFSNAFRVIVWLGPAADNSDLAMGQVSSLESALAPLRTSPLSEIDNATFRSLGLPASYDPIWPAFSKFFQRSWFQRLWIFQEAVLARDMIFLCGTKVAQWSSLQALCRTKNDFAFRDGAVRTNLQDALRLRLGDLYSELLYTVSTIREARKKGQQDSIIPITLRMSRHQATLEPVDRVYAILGLFDPEIRAQVDIDYSPASTKNYWKAYTQFFKALMLRAPHMAVMGLSSEEKLAHLPSWCINFNSTQNTSILVPIGIGAGGQAGDGFKKPDGTFVAAIPESNNLRILGVRADEVKDVVYLSWIYSIPWPRFLESAEPVCRVAKCLFECIGMAEENCITKSSFDQLTVVRSVVVNTLILTKGMYPREELAQDYIDFLAMVEFVEGLRTSPGLMLSPPSAQQNQGAKRFLQTFWYKSRGRAFFTTKNGRVGLGPKGILPGDDVCVWFHFFAPFILRKQADGRTSKLIGDAYVDDLMDGEIFRQRDFESERCDEFIVS